MGECLAIVLTNAQFPLGHQIIGTSNVCNNIWSSRCSLHGLPHSLYPKSWSFETKLETAAMLLSKCMYGLLQTTKPQLGSATGLIVQG